MNIKGAVNKQTDMSLLVATLCMAKCDVALVPALLHAWRAQQASS